MCLEILAPMSSTSFDSGDAGAPHVASPQPTTIVGVRQHRIFLVQRPLFSGQLHRCQLGKLGFFSVRSRQREASSDV